VPLGRQWAQAIELVKEYCIMAEDYGITLAIHNHGWLSVKDRVQFIEDCGSPDNLKLQLDVINCANRGEDLFETTRQCNDLLSKSMHVKDQRVMFHDDRDIPSEVRRNNTFRNFLCNIGDGNLVDWEAYLRLLKEINYDGFLNLESFTDRQYIGIPDWTSYEVGVDYLRKLGKKVGY
jgi:sugar phosphate isomerase/epimerase